MSHNNNEPMMDMFIYETTMNIDQLEDNILECEKTSCYPQYVINEIFRIMHTIKGSSSMMFFNNISTLAHSMEDLFFFVREKKPTNIDCETLSDLVLEGIDFIKVELEKIKIGGSSDAEAPQLIQRVKTFIDILKENNPSGDEIPKESTNAKSSSDTVVKEISKDSLKNNFKAIIHFEDGCEMENIRAYTVIHNLQEFTTEIYFFPEDIMENNDSVNEIRKNGFMIMVNTDKCYEEMLEFFNKTVFLKSIELIKLEDEAKVKESENNSNDNSEIQVKMPEVKEKKASELNSLGKAVAEGHNDPKKSIISVNVDKIDKLMDLMGEMVISEAMVIQNPDLLGLELNNFQKAARQLHKITSELQDIVMSIRMVSLSATFNKMNRIVRDMSKKLGKEVEIKVIGEETEVDKNIIEKIGDPLMHLVRNSIDHGIESREDRINKGKTSVGTITLEAKSSGGNVIIMVRDNGKGLNQDKILQKARDNEILTKSESEMTDKEIYNLIFLPGFSTKENITEFSGRGVGMDVVSKNVESIGGSISIDSTEGEGTSITLKIPLTLAIIDGMNIGVGKSRYTIPTTAITESFRPKDRDLIKSPDGSEMIMVRGQCYRILRLHEYYNIDTSVKNIGEGILIMIEQDNEKLCIFADELLGQQQVVVKPLPDYIKSFKSITGLSGCTLLGDGSISLILDIADITKK